MSKHGHGSKHAHGEQQPQRPRSPDVRLEHGGMPRRPDDEELARRTRAERARAGLTDRDSSRAQRARSEGPPDH